MNTVAISIPVDMLDWMETVFQDALEGAADYNDEQAAKNADYVLEQIFDAMDDL